MQIVVDMRWVLLIVLIILSGFFSASETALMSLNRVQVKRLVKKKKRGAESLERIREDPHRLLSTILIGNNLANVGASALVTAIAIEEYGSVGVGIATGIMTLVILVFGEITPKSFAIRNAEAISLSIAGIFELLEIALSPVIWVLDHIDDFMRVIMKSGADKEDLLTEEEITSIVSIGAEEGAIKEQEREMIYKIFKFDDIPVSDIMVPKPEVHMLDADTRISRLLAKANIGKMKEYSRFPVYEGTNDNVIGVFYFKTALGFLGKKTDKTVKDFIMPTLFVPETMKIDMLFFEFQKRKVHMALVVNEHGAVEGLVTLEDVLEEIVGEIQDETDVDSTKIKALRRGGYLVKASMRLDELNKALGIRLKDDENDTLGGYITKKLEHIPKKGEKFTESGIIIKVEKASKKRVKEVRIALKKK